MPLNLKIIATAENAVQVELEKEDYSIADIVHRELLNIKHVKFAGVPPPHPLIKTLSIQVYTDGEKPQNTLKDAISLARERVRELLAAANQTFPTSIHAEMKSEETDSDVENIDKTIGTERSGPL